ncbi:hypothetical protein E0Z10_g8786 [Xylaria hypoxylon]|uniref:Protein kinase domain-containing protein n=1 Tax=Xylaria hypoxylon TaxID=37992 RepID=A0A4Z0YM04_9PEZI|nr:hypothetical protein E0Z10_g8786 [Xylaria hypoxylon]
MDQSTLFKRITNIKNGNNGLIVPIGDITEIWTEDELKNIVQVFLTDTEIKFAQKHLLRTISLLVYVKAPGVGKIIHDWIKSEECWDQKLHKAERDNLNISLSEGELNQFFDALKCFTAPVLTEGEDMTLEGAQKMPLIGSEEVLGTGMNGVVTGHKIPRGHLKDKNGPNPLEISVAKKTFRNLTDDQQKQEINILKRLRGLLLNTNIQICSCISMITENSEVHSLSLRATSSLEDKLQELQTGGFNSAYLMDSIKQIKGVVSAVKFLHNSQSNGPNTCYCHMDIKPRNILVFGSGSASTVGEWKLIDFGITTISTKMSRKTNGGAREEGVGPHTTITLGISAKSMVSRYSAPEVKLSLKKKQSGEAGKYMGRGSDIWSLACVFAEVLAANLGQLGDLRGVADLQGDPMNLFYEEGKVAYIFPKPRRHNSFKKWLIELEERGKSDPTLRICHDLIDKMTHIKRIRRLKSEQVLNRMEESSELSESVPANT